MTNSLTLYSTLFWFDNQEFYKSLHLVELENGQNTTFGQNVYKMFTYWLSSELLFEWESVSAF